MPRRLNATLEKGRDFNQYMWKTKPEWANEAFATSALLYKCIIQTVIILEDSVSHQGLCAKYFNKWNKNRQCKLGMTWRSLPQGNHFCFAHPLVRLRSASFPVLKESCVSKMIFFKKAGGKRKVWREIMGTNQGCACALFLLLRTTLAASLEVCLLWAAGHCSAGLWAVLRVTLSCRSLVSPKWGKHRRKRYLEDFCLYNG